jgi:hypothetical protein
MTPAERNRRKAPELAAIVDRLRELYGTVRVEWVRMADGECLGPVPPEIAADMLHGIPDCHGADGRGDICRQVPGPNPLQSRRFHGTNGATRRRT